MTNILNKDLAILQKEQKEWTYRNFGDQPSHHPLFGMVEEMGELFHACLKYEQGIRDSSSAFMFEKKAQDAIGDLMIFLMGFCNKKGWDLSTIVNKVWEEVEKRNWKLYPKNGINE